MKRFRFPLERVLGYRRQLELDRRRALGMAMKAMAHRQEEMEKIAAEISSYRGRLAALGTGVITARDLALYRSYMTHLEARFAGAVKTLSEARRAVESRRAELAGASRDRQVLDKVRQHARSRHDYQADREETKALDEMGATVFLAAGGEAAAEGGAA